jgi:hypothetical protein
MEGTWRGHGEDMEGTWKGHERTASYRANCRDLLCSALFSSSNFPPPSPPSSASASPAPILSFFAATDHACHVWAGGRDTSQT